MEGVGSQLPDALVHFVGDLGEGGAHAAGDEKHIQSLRLQPNSFQDLLCALHPCQPALVAMFMVAVPQAAGHDVNAVSALFESIQ